MGVNRDLPMELVAVVGLVLFVVSEVMPFLPIKDNGILESLLHALRLAFPKPEEPAE